MQIIARQTLKQFWERHPPAEGPLRTWFMIVQRTAWTGPADVKRQFGGAVDFVGDNRANSKDSRYFGPVFIDDISGKALLVYWSTERAAGGWRVRWSRIGKFID